MIGSKTKGVESSLDMMTRSQDAIRRRVNAQIPEPSEKMGTDIQDLVMHKYKCLTVNAKRV